MKKIHLIKIVISWLLVFIWLIVIFVFSSMNSDLSNAKSEKVISKTIETTIIQKDEMNLNPETKEEAIKSLAEKLNLPFRKFVHAFVYLILALLALNALYQNGLRNKKLYIIALIICIIYALIDEYHQTFVDGRNGQLIDCLIDTIGSMIGIFLYKLINNKMKS